MNVMYELSDNSDQLATSSLLADDDVQNADECTALYSIGSVESIPLTCSSRRCSDDQQDGINGSQADAVSVAASLPLLSSSPSVDFSTLLVPTPPTQSHQLAATPVPCFAPKYSKQTHRPMEQTTQQPAAGATSTHQFGEGGGDCCTGVAHRLGSNNNKTIEIASPPAAAASSSECERVIGNDNHTVKSLVKLAPPHSLLPQSASPSCPFNKHQQQQHSDKPRHIKNTFSASEPASNSNPPSNCYSLFHSSSARHLNKSIAPIIISTAAAAARRNSHNSSSFENDLYQPDCGDPSSISFICPPNGQLLSQQHIHHPLHHLHPHHPYRKPSTPLIEEEFIMPNDTAIDESSNDDFKPGKISPPDSRSTTESIPERGQWSGQLDFIFSCISYAVGLGNVWRFPYLCYKNGGGAFLIPYLICVFTLGIPLFVMEVGLGQFTSSGGITIWNKIPIMKGVGYASMVCIGLCNCYYIIILSWTLYFLWNSFYSKLPWGNCDNDWNTAQCHREDGNITDAQTPASEFWKNKVLNVSDSFYEIGGIQIHLLITLVIAWIMVYFVIWKGIHQSGKIIWFTATFPYLILTILFGYGISLVGSGNGISFYLTPDWARLAEADIWIAAGTQLLFTYGIGIGTNIALGSYNTFHHNFFRDSLIACILSSCTSLFSGFVIFSVLGHLAHELGVSVDNVVDEGPGLTFVVYPEAVARLPLPQLWAILFFIMLLILGIDSQFCTVESFITGLVDEFPRFLRPRRKLFTTFVVIVHFIIGLSMITNGGLYIFQLMDNFSASGVSLLVVVLSEVVCFGWVYGGNNIYRHMETMLGYKPPRLFYYCWVFVAPLILLAILVFSIVRYAPPEMRKGVAYPWEGQLLGWIISGSSIICIPIYFVYYILYKSDPTLTIGERISIGFSDPTTNSASFESNSSLEESFNCDVEKCSAIDLIQIRDPNQNHIIGKPAPV